MSSRRRPSPSSEASTTDIVSETEIARSKLRCSQSVPVRSSPLPRDSRRQRFLIHPEQRHHISTSFNVTQRSARTVIWSALTVTDSRMVCFRQVLSQVLRWSWGRRRRAGRFLGATFFAEGLLSNLVTWKDCLLLLEPACSVLQIMDFKDLASFLSFCFDYDYFD